MAASLSANDLPFEIVMVGPFAPSTKMPENFKFVFSETKPHQRQMIATKFAEGALLCYFNDDWKIPRPNGLRELVDAWEACKDEDAMVAPLMPFSHPYLSFSTPTGYILPFGEVFSKKAFLKNGGFDTRFVGIYAGNDYAIRLQAAGKPVKILPEPAVTEHREGRLWGMLWEHDRAFLDWLWMDGYEVKRPRVRTFDEPLLPLRKRRKVPVQAYDLDREDLLRVNQGPVVLSDRWRNLCADCFAQRKARYGKNYHDANGDYHSAAEQELRMGAIPVCTHAPELDDSTLETIEAEALAGERAKVSRA
jgi:hypothetical protein